MLPGRLDRLKLYLSIACMNLNPRLSFLPPLRSRFCMHALHVPETRYSLHDAVKRNFRGD